MRRHNLSLPATDSPVRAPPSTSVTRTWILFGIAALALPAAVSAQAREFRLGPQAGQLTAEFTRIAGVRPLSDGRLVVLDAGDNRVFLADFERDTASQIGRQGQGPGEYRRPAAITALGRDSTLIVDVANRRWLVLDADRLVVTLPPDHPPTRAARGLVRTADQVGHLLVLGTATVTLQTQRIGKGDSVVAMLVALESARVDTVASLQAAQVLLLKDLDAAGKVTRVAFRQPPWSVGEEPLLFPDGWLAVARLDPYRVDWRTPSGDWVRGAPLPSVEPKTTSRERETYLASERQRTGKPAPEPPPDSWPATVPPFQPTPLVGAPDGSLLIRRTPTADHPGHRYDRVDRRGQLVGWLELASSDELIAVAGRHAYLVRTDDDGIQRLARCVWP